jgi:hypothetical protein
MPVWGFYAFDAYLIVFTVTTGVIFWWLTDRKKDRPPEKFKLLRGPGETQRRRVQKADENLSLRLFIGAVVPLVIVWLALSLVRQLPNRLVLVGAAKRSIRAVTTGSGTEPSSSTAAPARDANLGPNDGEIHAS